MGDLSLGASLGLLAGGLVFFSLVHSVLATDSLREWGTQRLGGRPERYRVIYNLVTIFLLAGVLIAARGDYPLVWRARGLARSALIGVQVAAFVGFVLTVCRFDLGAFSGLGPAANRVPGERLDTGGVYALCRHPLYFFTSLFFSSWPTMDLRWFIFALWLWIYSVLGSIPEERKLVRIFGDAYRDYQATHHRLLPLGSRAFLRRNQARPLPAPRSRPID